MPSPDSNIAFGELLIHLRQRGFTIGVGHYLRLQELLKKTGSDCSPQDLKTLLCPIFATNEIQQEQFYRAFDEHYGLFHQTLSKEVSASSAQRGESAFHRPEDSSYRLHKWLYILGAATLLVFTFDVSLWLLILTEGRAPAVWQSNANQQDLSGSKTPQPTSNQGAAEEPIPSPAINTEQELSFYRRYRSAFRVMGIAAPLIILLFYEWYRFRRRKVILQKQKGKKPPFTWPLRVEASAPKLFESDHFYGAARLMRRRQADEFYQLDIDGTIAATVESLGYPSFRYKVASKPPEYLFLIDRSSFRDHQALFFNELTKSLEREGVFVARYFYDGDPRICCQDGGEGCVHLVDLQNKFAGHRLLLIGNGEKLIDPVTGRVQPWARTFSAWQNRAVLTPEDVTRWGLSESSLAGQFVVRPATSQGLRASIESFEATLRSGPYRRIKGVVEPPQFEDLSITETVASLRTYLGEEIFQWVCACAIYPELQWDLTLYLGSLPCLGQGLIREDNLLKLVRLPWFRAGTMPDELRWHLIRELDREKERAIRIALIELLEKNPPPKETFAANSYELNLVVQRWLSFRDRQRRREMIQALNAGPRSQILQDYTVMRFLESAPESSLSMILPRKFRKVFFQNGIPAFGVKTGFRILLTLAVAATAWFVMRPGQGQSDANPLQQRTTSNTSRTTSNTNSALTDLTLVVRDDFSSEKWASDNNENKYEDGEYHMHASTGNYIVVLGPDLNDYYTKDRTMRVRARSVDGTASSYGYGLVVHGTLKSGENRAAVGYAFLVYTGNDPSYAVYHLTGDQDRTLVKWTNSSVVLSGTNTNQLEVRIKGDQISYYVNGQYMTSITDSAGYGDGRVGFYTSNDNPVAFDDLEIYK